MRALPPPTDARAIRNRIRAFADFAFAQQAAGDLDPAYPVIRWLLASDPPESRALAVVRYVAHYHVGSWWAAWSGQAADRDPNVAYRLPTGIERRGLRDPQRMRRHLREVYDIDFGTPGGMHAFLAPPADSSPADGWGHVVEQATRLWGNGRWAAYKTADLCAEVLGWRIAAPDTGMDGATGSRAGMETVYGEEVRGETPAQLEARAARLRLDARRANGIILKLSEVETVLCDFHSAAGGRYYPGHDVDQMAAQLTALEILGYDMGPVWRARAETLPHSALGELADPPWLAPDRARCRVFRDHGHILHADEGR